MKTRAMDSISLYSDRSLTVSERKGARLGRCRISTLRQLAEAGFVGTITIGTSKRVRYMRADIEALLASGVVRAATIGPAACARPQPIRKAQPA